MSLKRHSHTIKTRGWKGIRQGGPTTKFRRLMLWRSGTCLQNKYWFERKAKRVGHESTGITAWDPWISAVTPRQLS